MMEPRQYEYVQPMSRTRYPLGHPITRPVAPEIDHMTPPSSSYLAPLLLCAAVWPPPPPPPSLASHPVIPQNFEFWNMTNIHYFLKYFSQ
jgi:hypothetical protein